MKIVEFILTHRTWKSHCLRVNICTPDQVEQYKKIKIAHIESNALGKSEHILRHAIKNIAPEWFGDGTRVCLNRNVKCEKHRDGNVGLSWILWLGDFTGGALCFETGSRIEEKYKWHHINGQIPHWNEPHVGTKYAIIIYMSPGTTKSSRITSSSRNRKTTEADVI